MINGLSVRKNRLISIKDTFRCCQAERKEQTGLFRAHVSVCSDLISDLQLTSTKHSPRSHDLKKIALVERDFDLSFENKT